MNLWKKLASMLLCLALLLSLVPVGAAETRGVADAEGIKSEEALAEEEKELLSYLVEGGNLYFDPATGRITKCDTKVTSAVIPSEIGGVAVTKIGDGAFMYCFDLTYVSPLDEYSIVTYATNMMNSNAPEQVKRICANLLRYGAATQIYMGYDVENLANAALTEEQRSWLVDTDTVEFANRYAEVNDLAEPQVKWYGKTLVLNSTISLKFAVDATDFEGDSEELELRVTYTDIDGKTQTATAKPAPYGNTGTHWVFVIDSLDVPELRAELSCRVYAGDTPVSRTMIYSADSYCNGKTGALLDLCKALFAYVDESEAYFMSAE